MKYARLRQDCAERDNVLYNESPEKHPIDDDVAHSPWRLSERSASLQQDFLPELRPTQAASSSAGGPPFFSDMTEALKMLAASQDSGSRRFSERCEAGAANDDIRSRSSSERWPNDAQDGECDSQDPEGSGRWGSAETASLSARWGSVSTNDQWDDAEQGTNSFHDPLSLFPWGRLTQEENPCTGSTTAPSTPASIQRKPSVRNAPSQEWLNALTGHPSPTSRLTVHPFPGNSDDHLDLTTSSVQQTNFLRETQEWLASVKCPLQSRKHTPWEDPDEFNWRAAATTTTTTTDPSKGRRRPPLTVSQSIRYNRLRSSDQLTSSGGEIGFFHDGDRNHHSVLQKAASMREPRLHGDPTKATARACNEKYGMQRAILNCVSCGRASQPIVQGNSSRLHGVGDWTRSASTRSESTNSKRKGVIHFCRKFMRIGKKLDK